ncbi:BON domain-containing protein [Plasticicumulans acidivorans]|uniref:Osmotically-inducible protein OsmY n=1 Tax=Plasticicumulans acidivorans TaxID=886464 RepID=A0A317MV70_9GAMM|nr:BON domain-containing protein [Plasticicumulans acidivorans]PWV61818.1 osmotically-inducible protein OsmY [Plasticicumulans acidivorans]
MKHWTRLSSITALTIALQGCAGALIGGAATAVGVAHDRRTAGTYVEDETIEQKSTHALEMAGLSSRGHINATSYNRAVLLTGEIADRASRNRAETAVRGVEQVKTVYNELAIMPASSFASRSSDTWITTKVKTALFQVDGIRDFDPTRVKVVTERGIVYLMGLLRPREAEAVTATVRHVAGVQKVVRIFEYLE